ncbi:MAG: malonyl-CoA O-methyltransferase [Francisella sp.]|jgi:malonyl-CoA O-methyltransferase
MFNYNLFLKLLSNRNDKHPTSFIKNEIADRLLKRLEFINLSPKSIYLDGYSDDEYIVTLKSRFPNSVISTDENLMHDLIISNTIIHLTENIADRLEQYHEMLNHEGVLLFSTFGDKCFSTLNNAFSTRDNLPHTNGMIDAKTWGGMLQSSAYKSPAIESDIITLTYEKTATLFNDIRELNEPLADTKMNNHFTGKKAWQKVLQELEKNLKLEIEALYGYAVRKIDDNTLAPRPNPNRVSLDELKKQIMEFKGSSKT